MLSLFFNSEVKMEENEPHGNSSSKKFLFQKMALSFQIVVYHYILQ